MNTIADLHCDTIVLVILNSNHRLLGGDRLGISVTLHSMKIVSFFKKRLPDVKSAREIIFGTPLATFIRDTGRTKDDPVPVVPKVSQRCRGSATL